MSRLTEKIEDRYTCDYSLASVLCNKLGQIEDIEDELGMSLIAFYKLLKTRKFTDGKKDMIFFGFSAPDYEYILDPFGTKFKVADYGKTWALTKEELEQ